MLDPRVAQVVAEALTHFDEQRYRLLAWCVMPNHVHVVFEPEERLDKTLHSWKSFTAKAANKILARSGDFWQEEYFDRTIRNASEFAQTVRYVEDNPTKACLHGWQWVRTYPERF